MEANNGALSVTYDSDVNFSAPELFLFGMLLAMVVIALLLYLDTHGWIQRLMEERKRLRKALQYKPNDDRVTPVENPDKEAEKDGEKIDDIIVEPKKDQNKNQPDAEINNDHLNALPGNM